MRRREGRCSGSWTRTSVPAVQNHPRVPGRDGARPGLAVLLAVEMSNTVHVHPQAVHRRDTRTRTRTLPLWRRTLSQLSYIPLPVTGKPGYNKNRPFRLPGERSVTSGLSVTQ